MEKIKKSVVYIPLIATVLFIAIGIAVLIANQPNEIKANTSGESIGFIENNAGNDLNLAGGVQTDESGNPTLPHNDDSRSTTVPSRCVGIFLVFSIILITVVPILAIIFADKQKKKIYYKKK